MKPLLCLILLGTTALTASSRATGGADVPRGQAQIGLFLPADVPWTAGPASLRPGAEVAVLEGDPTRDGVFTIRLRLPNGFEVAPHWHTQVEHVTVVSGVLHFGMGEKFDRAATRPMPAGSFGHWPIGMKHFAWAEGETTLQLHGKGPWTITYVNPADDPRGKK